jgi:hypothetical protein
MCKKSSILCSFTIILLMVGWTITPAWAHCVDEGVHSGEHPHCTNDAGPAGGGEYGVTVTGEVSSGGFSYTGRDGGGKSKPVDVSFQFMSLGLSFFEGVFDSSGCFKIGVPVEGDLTSMSILEDKEGNSVVQYWFTGYGDDGLDTKVSYRLAMFGSFNNEWRPTTTTKAILTSWKMNIEGGGSARKIACLGDGELDASVEVTRTN